MENLYNPFKLDLWEFSAIAIFAMGPHHMALHSTDLYKAHWSPGSTDLLVTIACTMSGHVPGDILDGLDKEIFLTLCMDLWEEAHKGDSLKP